MIFNINSTRGQTRFLTCVARVTCLVRNKRSTKLGAVQSQIQDFPKEAAPFVCQVGAIQ